MALKCDGCGTEQNVKRAFVTIWNGHILDLCKPCAKPLVAIIDTLNVKRWLTP